jgi:hypothetical protein
MKGVAAIVLSIVVSCVCADMAWAEIKEGLWEITTTSKIKGGFVPKGMPAQIPSSTMHVCINKKDAVPIPPSDGKGPGCKIKEQRIAGDSVTYTMECIDNRDVAAEISGKITYKGGAMEGTGTVKFRSPNYMVISTKDAGKYIGPCMK